MSEKGEIMHSKMKNRVLDANLKLHKYGLVTLTWGNVSEIDRQNGVIAIKPSGVDYDVMRTEDIVIVDLDGRVVEGKLNPSSDTATHLEIYKAFPQVGGVVHSHSRCATIWAQASIDIPALGTTHADYFYGDIPCTRQLSHPEIMDDYEKHTGLLIVEEFHQRRIAPMEVPSVLVAAHGPFSWGYDADDAVHNAIVLEEISAMALSTRLLNSNIKIQPKLSDKHYQRKHGENAYYGQR